MSQRCRTVRPRREIRKGRKRRPKERGPCFLVEKERKKGIIIKKKESFLLSRSFYIGCPASLVVVAVMVLSNESLPSSLC